MRLALIVMVDNLEPKIGVALDERGPYIRYIVGPTTAVCAEHRICMLIVLQPCELIEPIGPKTAALATCRSRGCGWSSGWCCDTLNVDG